MFTRMKEYGLLAGALVMSGSTWAVGPTADQLTPSVTQRASTSTTLGQTTLQASPAVAFGSPIGFGFNWGQVGIGIGGQTLPKGDTNHVDGSMGVAAGFGDSRNTVGVELTANIISLRDNFGQDGSFNAKIHRMLDNTTSVAIGAESFGGYGAARDARTSGYAALTKVFYAGMPVVVNAGIGSDRFRSVTPTHRYGAFGSIAVIPTERLSLVVDFTGVDTNAGISVVPLASLPLTLTVGYVNLSENQGLTREFAGGAGYLVRF